ncbi:MAG: hypothetical protein AAFX65_05945 [Cyanobacteria bacterium J06638_7]
MGLRHGSRVPAGGFALLIALSPAVAHAQMLTGCRLVQGSLQCVPGLTADPQTQIQILDQEISTAEQQEGAIEQTIEGIEGIELLGDAFAGAVLTASLQGTVLAAQDELNYHWYQRAEGSDSWVLIETASGSTFTPGPGTVGQWLIVVLTVSEANGVKRLSSPPVGPIQAAR